MSASHLFLLCYCFLAFLMLLNLSIELSFLLLFVIILMSDSQSKVILNMWITFGAFLFIFCHKANLFSFSEPYLTFTASSDTNPQCFHTRAPVFSSQASDNTS